MSLTHDKAIIGQRTPSLPCDFRALTIEAGDAALFVQVGGQGDPVVLLHGYVQTGDMWGPLASPLPKLRA